MAQFFKKLSFCLLVKLVLGQLVLFRPALCTEQEIFQMQKCSNFSST